MILFARILSFGVMDWVGPSTGTLCTQSMVYHAGNGLSKKHKAVQHLFD